MQHSESTICILDFHGLYTLEKNLQIDFTNSLELSRYLRKLYFFIQTKTSMIFRLVGYKSRNIVSCNFLRASRKVKFEKKGVLFLPDPHLTTKNKYDSSSCSSY